MLYLFNEKIYVKPSSNIIVEVEVTKKGEEYDVKATSRKVDMNKEQKDSLVPIGLEEAYKHQNKVENLNVENTEKNKKQKKFF